MESNSKTGTNVKKFTLKEANNALPEIEKMFERVFSLNNNIKSLNHDIENLVSIWGKDVMEKGHIDSEYYLSLTARREAIFQELMGNVQEIQKLGCIVRDINTGLIDFYHDNNGNLVFLCWKYGEDKVKHWHTLNGGPRTKIIFNRL